jgi:hypothetical protein
MILILGILSLMVCMPLGILAWILGADDLKAMDAGTMDPGGRGTTNVGKILGIIGTILMILTIIGAILFVALVGIGAATAAHH